MLSLWCMLCYVPSNVDVYSILRGNPFDFCGRGEVENFAPKNVFDLIFIKKKYLTTHPLKKIFLFHTPNFFFLTILTPTKNIKMSTFYRSILLVFQAICLLHSCQTGLVALHEICMLLMEWGEGSGIRKIWVLQRWKHDRKVQSSVHCFNNFWTAWYRITKREMKWASWLVDCFQNVAFDQWENVSHRASAT